ncbi:MAG: T9SS type A sorting domain-containing protein [Sphingobacteriales bacterium]|nr:T9SS type A sorting domain-containing protein [Sphingobacteriales bacterium]
MRTRILLLAFLLSAVFTIHAQTLRRAFAITGNNGVAAWENISEVDLSAAQFGKQLFNNSTSPFSMIDAVTRKTLPLQMINNGVQVKSSPTATMVAAAAYDEAHNKLFFTPMRINELRWIDLDDKSQVVKTYTVSDRKFINADVNNTANQITRMCIGTDGYGYAMSNDALHLLRFSTGKNISVTDLGSVIDDGNKTTINSPCGGWGGDMVADTKGNLYVISAQHNIFRVNIETKVSTFITKLNDIPAEYTTNGAAVDDAGFLILGSANGTGGFYKVDPNTWKTEKMTAGNGMTNVSDLASSNYLFDSRTNKSITKINDIREVYNEKISAYPNPVSDGYVKISFDQQPKGNYAVQLVDLTGRVLTSKQISVAVKSQVETLNVDPNIAQGFYMLRVMNSDKKTVLVKKLFVE